MRLWLGLLAVAVVTGGFAHRAAAQSADVRYWPLREINFPVPVDKIQDQNPRPTKLRFYAAANRGSFKLVTERGINDLEVIDADKNRRGFKFSSPADGEYDFALQFVYADGEASPRESELTAQYRVVFDTKPPVVRVTGAGSGIDWVVDDENLGPDAVTLQVRWQGTREWTNRTPREFRPRDGYTWNRADLTQPLEVRVLARDRAGLEMASRIVTLPTSGTGGSVTGNERPPSITPDDYRPSIDYVNTRNLTVESKLTRVTRSGVKAAHLWVKDDKTGWRKDKEVPVNITPNSPDTTIRIPYAATKDGLYGFIVIPVNGAGGKQDDPRSNDPAQILVQVDTEIPHVKIKKIHVAPGGAIGPKVEIEWEAVDPNLMPDPIVLEYAEERTAAEWKPIATKIANSGRYVWQVEDKNVWKFYVRVKAIDKASNQGEHVYEKEVIIDLDTPQAVIEGVRGGPRNRPQPTPTPSQPRRDPEPPPAFVPERPSPSPSSSIPTPDVKSPDLVAPPPLDFKPAR